MGKTWNRLRDWVKARTTKTTIYSSGATPDNGTGETPTLREQMKAEIGGAAPGAKESPKPPQAPRALSREEAIQEGVGAYMKAWAIIAEGEDADFRKASNYAQEGTMLFGALLFAKYGMTSAYAEEIGFGLGVVTMIAAGQARTYYKRQREELREERSAEGTKRGPGRPPKVAPASVSPTAAA